MTAPGTSSAMPGGRSLADVAPVLVVDDDAAGSAATEAILSSSGYATETIALGDEVLRLVRASLVRVVVSEIYIPCSEGRCVVTALKQERTRLPRLRVLVHTRHTSKQDVEWALNAGADTIVYKPAPDALLVRELQRLVGGPQ